MSYRRVVMLLALVVVLAVPVRAEGHSVMIRYLPHPDDETIGMADAIHQSVLACNTNYFIFFTKGENSLARHGLKGPDGTSYQLSPGEFGQARVNETLAALQVLGVGPENVIFFDYPDGAIPQEAVERTIEFFATLYPGAVHNTVSIYDDHEDHQTLARALASAANRFEPELNTRYYSVYIYRNPTLLDSDVVEKHPVANPSAKSDALAQFTHWDPAAGRYAIAGFSTPDLVAAAAASPYEYVQSASGAAKHWPRPKPFLKLSNLGLELGLPIQDRVSIAGMFDFTKASLGSEVALRLQDDIPLIQLVASLGYHFGEGKPYLGFSAEFGRHYFVTVRHIWKADTQLGIGLKANTF